MLNVLMLYLKSSYYYSYAGAEEKIPALQNSSLQFVSKQNLTQFDGEYFKINSVCFFSDDDVLLALVDGSLRSVSMCTGRFTALEPSVMHVAGVAFDWLTDTLLVLTSENHKWELVSLRRSGSKLVEVQRIDACSNYFDLCHLTQCNSRILLAAKGNTSTMDVFDVDASHTLRKAGSVPLQSWFSDVACSGRDGYKLVSISLERYLTLWRLSGDPLRLEQLATVELNPPILVQFYGDLLFVAEFNVATQKHDISSFRSSGNALNERKMLLEAQHGVSVGAWALTGKRLVIVDWDSKDLLSYTFA